MRDALAAREGLRSRYRAVVARFGSKPAYQGPAIPTILLVDVTDAQGTLVADHLWFTLRQCFARLCLEAGDRIEFEARVTPYQKGYQGRDDLDSPRELDYRLSFPTRVRKIEPVSLDDLPLFQPRR